MHNILYVTNRCNIDCEYCFQKEERLKTKAYDSTYEELQSIIDNNKNGSFSLMGGEPFLNEKVLFEIIRNNPKNRFALNTNGLYFAKLSNVKKYKELNADNVSLEISYDGYRHFLRHDNAGKDTAHLVIKALHNLMDADIPFRIRYSITELDAAKIKQDLIFLCLEYKPKRLFINYIFNMFDKALTLDDMNNWVEQELKTFCEHIYYKFNIPVCMISCDVCPECLDRSQSIIANFGKLSIDYKDLQAKKFNLFTLKEENEKELVCVRD